MTILQNAQNVVINNGHFTEQITINHPIDGSGGIDILLGASVPAAAYDSSARSPPPRCFPGTREQYVEDVLHWALPAIGDASLPIYWMKGPAGVGKSAIAQTCVEKLKHLGNLGAAFFFSINRQNKESNNPINDRKEHQKFFTSIAYQLSTIYPEYRDILDTKIRRDKTIVDKTIESQFWGLIVEPLRELEANGKGIGRRLPVFVDGLDECDDRDAQCEIIEIVAAAAHLGVMPLCWAFFSRPEPHIEASFSKAGVFPLCHITVLPISRDADGDIELYLRAGFESILRRLNVTLDSPWPSDNDLEKLVHAAGGLFIYAVTLLRFLSQPDSLGPEELLRAVLAIILARDQSNTIADHPFAELDAFYMLIMRRIPPKVLPSIHPVLAMLAQTGPSSAVMVANMLGLSRAQLETLCNQMSAVIHFQRQDKPLELDPTIDTSHPFLHAGPGVIPTEVYNILRDSLGGSISFYHKSFSDFLRDPARSKSYCVNTSAMQDVGKRKLRFRLNFEQSYSWRGSELVRAPGFRDSASCLTYPYTNELVNSLLGALIYTNLARPDMGTFVDMDFRKHIYFDTNLMRSVSGGSELIVRHRPRHFTILYKYAHGTVLGRLPPRGFQSFDVANFKEFIKERRRANIIRPYYPNFASRIRSVFRVGGRAGVDSGLYLVGRGSSSIFWYWEINYNMKSYREFMTLDLIEGEKRHREERFDPWV